MLSLKQLFVLISAIVLLCQSLCAQQQSLKVLTVNVWSGLNYEGVYKSGEYETKTRRERRFISLLLQIRAEQPDIIFLQEVNPAADFSSRLADSLGYDEIHHVCNAGLKLWKIGIPINLNEGLAIFAKRKLQIEKYDVWKLSGSPGINGDYINIHFDEAEYALIGKIKINDVPFYLINVHLYAAVGQDSSLRITLDSLVENKLISKEDYDNTLPEWGKGIERQNDEMKELLKGKRNLSSNNPIIMAGDFNTTPNSQVIKNLQVYGRLFNTFEGNTGGYLKTWNPKRNQNFNYCLSFTANGDEKSSTYDKLSLEYDKKSKTIDYIFLNNCFSVQDVKETKIVLDSSVNGVQPSDHFGVLSKIDIRNSMKYSFKESDYVQPIRESSIEPFPILTYDTDAGLGYGAKVFLLNLMKMNESFDMLLFNSTKGERWYRFVFSVPDFDLRQFKKYPLSIDLIVDYDKWISSNFFGIGNNTNYEDKQTYTKEPFEVSLLFGHAFSKKLVTQAGVKYQSVKNSNFSKEDVFFLKYPQLKQKKITYLSLYFNFRFDTRNTYTNPSKGSVLQLETEIVPKTKFNDVKFTRFGLWFQHYITLCYPKTVFALRFGLKSLTGNDIPVQNLLSLGGNSSLRGSPQDRYLDKALSILNAELRFPIYWRFGGIIGVDAGKVWNSISKFDFKKWAVNPTLGLRFYMNTFVIRFDVGFGKETTGIYFNFGQLF